MPTCEFCYCMKVPVAFLATLNNLFLIIKLGVHIIVTDLKCKTSA